jgi:DNA-binding NtrC family response regulator
MTNPLRCAIVATVNPKPALLIVDDDPLIGESLSFALRDDYRVQVAQTRAEALALARKGATDVALVDLGLPPLTAVPTEGFRLVSELIELAPRTRILILTGQNEASNARRALALGAFALVPKPCDPRNLRRQLHEALNMSAAPTAPDDGRSLVGESAPIRALRAEIDTIAPSHHPVLIEGESGSGKERVASLLHHLSSRANLPFLALNCAAISASLVEPTLFGYARGAFTGAAQAKSGYFEDSGEGTLFLDEIGELPLELQPKLLRVLENGEFQRVGETQTRTSRARVVAATNRNLKAEVRAGRFRADLYHRLSVFSIDVPPLRDLGADKLILLEHFRRNANGGTEPAAPAFGMDSAARALWAQYAFPGNVRELKNIVIRLAAKHGGYTVTRDALAAELADVDPAEQGFDPRREIEAALAARTPFVLDRRLAEHERAYLDAAIAITRGNMSEAARVLGISRSTLYSRIEALKAHAAAADNAPTIHEASH